MSKTITTIPATHTPTKTIHSKNITKRKVAAYARVSTDMDEQARSTSSSPSPSPASPAIRSTHSPLCASSKKQELKSTSKKHLHL